MSDDGCKFWDVPQVLVSLILKDSPIQLALGYTSDEDSSAGIRRRLLTSSRPSKLYISQVL